MVYSGDKDDDIQKVQVRFEIRLKFDSFTVYNFCKKINDLDSL